MKQAAKRWVKVLTRLAILASTLGATVPMAQAQVAYPQKQVTLLIPFNTQGLADTMARPFAESLGKQLAQTLHLRYEPGFIGIRGTQALLQTPADGHTLLLGHLVLSTAPALFARLPYDATTDLIPIAHIGDVPLVLVAKPELPIATLKGAIQHLRERRAKGVVTNTGTGSIAHLCGELIRRELDVDLQMDFQKTPDASYQQIRNGKADLYCDTWAQVKPLLDDRAARPLAVTGPARLPQLSDVPTLRELGFAKADMQIWHSIFVAKGTQTALVDRLREVVATALQDPALASKYQEIAAAVPPADQRDAQAAKALLESDTARWRPLLEYLPRARIQ